MYENILVPLDGSGLAECVFPHLEKFIASGLVHTVALVRVVEPAPTRFDDTAALSSKNRDQIIESARIIEEYRQGRAATYLKAVSSRLKHDGVNVKTEVLCGRVAESLADYSEANGVELIIIATHGRSGISRWVRGSVADRVLRFSRIPVLMVQADGVADQR